ncbi:MULTISPECIES: retropepsin-like aspartic protease [Flavobacteriaceae]|uniref:retropepsin-like aspartic protease n=1 Tax=Flavobacteriaceae TaxID=49546 RepID=UPI0014913480|nr:MULTISPECIES: retropepsin-like aspartic protease [Allomuricauda]MDC6364877.1 retropepsin-like aspartic protease [Muricauda sp. AC10]
MKSINIMQRQIAILLVILSHYYTSSQNTKLDLEKKEVNIPVDLSTQRPIIALNINEKGSYKFIFDTGAGRNFIDEELSKELKLEVIGKEFISSPGTNRQVISNRVTVPQISMTNVLTSKNVNMNTMPLRKMLPIHGVIGGMFFKNHLLSINYPKSILTITKGELKEDADNVIPFNQDSRILSTEISVAGNKQEAHLDSGNPGNIDIPFKLKDKLEFVKEPLEDGMIRTSLASHKRWKATLKGDIVIGNLVYKSPEVNLIEGFEFVNLGFQFFNQSKITIDRVNNLLKIEKSSSKRKDANNFDITESASNEYTGWYGGKVRSVFLEDGQMYLQRVGGPKIKLEMIKKDYYKMTFSMPTANELPNVQFERNANQQITGLTFVHSDGKKDFSKKD